MSGPNVDALNHAFQMAQDVATGRAVLGGCSTAQLRALADLNYCEEPGAGRAELIADLITSRFEIGAS